MKIAVNINGAYVRLIRELCDLVARKKEDICTIIWAELIESKMARAKLKNYIKSKEMELGDHIEEIKRCFTN